MDAVTFPRANTCVRLANEFHVALAWDGSRALEINDLRRKIAGIVPNAVARSEIRDKAGEERDAKSCWSGSTFSIYVDQALPSDEQRIAVAHEIGHGWMHDDDAPKATRHMGLPFDEPDDGYRELQAEFFGTVLLCPFWAVRNIVNERVLKLDASADDMNQAIEQVMSRLWVPRRVARGTFQTLRAFYHSHPFVDHINSVIAWVDSLHSLVHYDGRGAFEVESLYSEIAGLNSTTRARHEDWPMWDSGIVTMGPMRGDDPDWRFHTARRIGHLLMHDDRRPLLPGLPVGRVPTRTLERQRAQSEIFAVNLLVPFQSVVECCEEAALMPGAPEDLVEREIGRVADAMRVPVSAARTTVEVMRTTIRTWVADYNTLGAP